MSVSPWVVRCLFGAALLWTHLQMFASPVYHFTYARFGDTAAPTMISNRGVIVYRGFGDSYNGGASYVEGLGYVVGYGDRGPDDIHAGVQVEKINDAGDLYGNAIRTDGVRVPTIWLDGVPYDLTDPANAELSFHNDPGPTHVNGFNLLALNIPNLPLEFFPTDFLPCDEPFDWGYGLCKRDPILISSSRWALTNARGDFVFNFDNDLYVNFRSYGILTRVLPEPSTLPLALVALVGALAIAARRKPVSRSSRIKDAGALQ